MGGKTVAIVLALVASATAIPIPAKLVEKDGMFCRYTNRSLIEGCNSTSCETPAVIDVPSAADLCEDIYLHGFTQIVPFMKNNFTTPYLLEVKGCPSMGVDTLHVPLLAFRTGNRYRSMACSSTCGKMCERLSDSFAYSKANLHNTMVPICHCKALLKTPLVPNATQA